MKRAQILMLLLIATALSAVQALTADSGQIAIKSELKASADASSKTLATLNAGSTITVAERKGAWYHISSAQGEGWVRMLNIRLSGAQIRGGDSALSGIQALGQASRSNTTVATGIRGLSKENLQKAHEDEQELARLDQYTVSEKEALRFGKDGHLPLPR
jgi:hypothetical protein